MMDIRDLTAALVRAEARVAELEEALAKICDYADPYADYGDDLRAVQNLADEVLTRPSPTDSVCTDKEESDG